MPPGALAILSGGDIHGQRSTSGFLGTIGWNGGQARCLEFDLHGAILELWFLRNPSDHRVREVVGGRVRTVGIAPMEGEEDTTTRD